MKDNKFEQFFEKNKKIYLLVKFLKTAVKIDIFSNQKRLKMLKLGNTWITKWYRM